MKKMKPHQTKLDDRSIPVVFIGYEAGTKAYRVFDPVSQRVHVTRDLIFDEKRGWDWSKKEDDGGWHLGDFIVEVSTTVHGTLAPTTSGEGGACWK
uniref:Retroviral polymerase SH3-like domain-containing protein n=1 Tax=Arundo donax TaxID=35708 RepID=A0A0A9HJS9_ARUDO